MEVGFERVRDGRLIGIEGWRGMWMLLCRVELILLIGWRLEVGFDGSLEDSDGKEVRGWGWLEEDGIRWDWVERMDV
ncbi:hypothetical protein [Candidatus Hodgkinia cicadicola]|uniref:hypothetical protein n=1 Tax=Candidatus Hodgkinia cicadicola TaxID=573658 RepID=UPI0011BACB12